MTSPLKDRTVVIAGAAGGLGSVASATFAAAGANLVLLGRDQKKLEVNAQELKLPSGQVLILSGDATSEADMQKQASAALSKFGHVDVLINLVGGWIGGKEVLGTPQEDFRSMLDQHLFSSVALIKAFVPPMVANKWGRVLAVSSPNASRPPGKSAPYAAGKAAMEAVMLSLAQELKGSGVTANLILVKTIDTEHQRMINPSKENQSWTSPEEISATLLHLCSQEAGLINGARIPMYGEP